MKNNTIRRMAEILRLMDEARNSNDPALLQRALNQSALLTGDLSDRFDGQHGGYDYHDGLRDSLVRNDAGMGTNVFVYGTLKQGYGNNRVLQDSEFLGHATVKDYGLIDGGIPYAVYSPGSSVIGEVFHVTSQSVMERLDMLEGYPHHYARDYVTFDTGDGDPHGGRAWMYVVDHHRPATTPLVSEWQGRNWKEHMTDA